MPSDPEDKESLSGDQGDEVISHDKDLLRLAKDNALDNFQIYNANPVWLC